MPGHSRQSLVRRNQVCQTRPSRLFVERSKDSDAGQPELPAARRHPRRAAAVQRRPVDRRGVLPRAPARRRVGRRRLGDHHQRARLRSRRLQLRRAAPRARDHAGRDRRPRADRSTASTPRAPRGRAPRAAWRPRRRLGAAGLSLGRLHLRPAPRDGGRALPADRGRHRPAADHLPVPARRRAGLSARRRWRKICDAVPTVRAIKDWSREPAAARAPDPRAAVARRGRSTCSPRTAPGC